MSNQFVFKRYEVKYLVTDEQRARIERAMAPFMVADEHGESTICNVYYDTPSHLLVRRSCEKPVYKEKVRVRSYGRLSEGDEMFVELKKKYDGVVYKRRICADAAHAESLLSGTCMPVGQIEREIAFTAARYEGLEPACYIAYDRCAYFAEGDRDFRVTFDRNIRWRTERLSLSEDTDGEQLLEPGFSLMEVKCAGAMPLWLVRELSAMRLFKTSFSKYGTAWERSCVEVAVSRTGLVPLLPAQPAHAPAPIPYPARIRTPRHAAQAHVA
ncbi:MAG: polyphosphate polymerase domain-containing protein [Atopobiaceae bacterium]|nr:polyphosphate polymerase domain-containing protein [Atopobiaceae bacterium]